MKKDFLSITDLSAKEIWQIFAEAKKLKKNPRYKNKAFLEKSLVMIFEKPSLRTKLTFDLGMKQLGGVTIYFGPDEVGLGKREKIGDVAQVISKIADLIMARVFNHQTLVELTKYATIPVINGLSDWEHPVQVLSDLFTIWEEKKKLDGLKVAYVGDGANNLAHSLSLGCLLMGVKFSCSSPKGFTNPYSQIAKPEQSVKNADVVMTDIWVSMGLEKEKAKRARVFKPYQVNQKLMSLAKKDAIFMHCLPAHRGEEVTDEVIDSAQSMVFTQAQNRLYVQKALLLFLIGKI